ncbi:dehydrogenase [Halobacteriaceae archaeon GCM10025711]
MLVAVAASAVAGVAILSHLADPLRALVFPFTLTNLGSWITRGTWILVALAVFATVQALWLLFGTEGARDSTPSRFPRRIAGAFGLLGFLDGLADRLRPGPAGRRVVALLGLVPALATVYTGFELATVWTVPLWDQPVLLPLSFLGSGLAAGVAVAVGLTAVFEGADSRTVAQYSGVVAVLLVGTLATLGVYWTRLGASDSLATVASVAGLQAGNLGLAVWTVALGLALPAVALLGFAALRLAGVPVLQRRAGTTVLVGSTLLVVVASFTLRVVVLYGAVKIPIGISGV